MSAICDLTQIFILSICCVAHDCGWTDEDDTSVRLPPADGVVAFCLFQSFGSYRHIPRNGSLPVFQVPCVILS